MYHAVLSSILTHFISVTTLLSLSPLSLLVALSFCLALSLSLSLGRGPRALCAAMNDSSPSAVDVLGLENKEGKRGQGRRVQEGEMR